MNKRRGVILAGAVFFLGVHAVVAFHDGHDDEGPTDRVFKIARSGEVNIGVDLTIGARLLKRGKYTLAHRTEGASHIFKLSRIEKKPVASSGETIEFNTGLLRTVERIKDSTLQARQRPDHNFELVKIQMVGETGDHLLSGK
jgi:hypothetical protein